MTLRTNARIAGFTFLFYIAAGITSMVLFGRATRGTDIAEKLASIAQNDTRVRVVVLLGLLMSFSAVVLGVTLYAITREVDPDLAMFGLTCRVIEGVNNAASISETLGLVWLASAAGTKAVGAATAESLGAYLLRQGPGVSAIFFAVGSTFFCWLLLRGRMIPTWMAWLGVASSLLLVVALPLQLFGSGPSFSGPVGWLIWVPMLVFEVAFALWLIFKGVAAPATRRPTINQPPTVS